MKKMQLIKKFNNIKNKNSIFKYFKMSICLFIIIINLGGTGYNLKRVYNVILMDFQRDTKKRDQVFN